MENSLELYLALRGNYVCGVRYLLGYRIHSDIGAAGVATPALDPYRCFLD